MLLSLLLLAAAARAQTTDLPLPDPALPQAGAPSIQAEPAPALEAVPALDAAPSLDAAPALNAAPLGGDRSLSHSPEPAAASRELSSRGAELSRALAPAGRDGFSGPDAASVVGTLDRVFERSEALSAAPEQSAAEEPAAVLLERVGDPELRDSLEKRIYQDPLTKLPKRSWLEDRLGDVLRRNASVMLIDLDHFKTRVNDAHGHAVGDIALQELSRILAAHEKPGLVAARWGGEEFVLVTRSLRADAERDAETLRADVERRLGAAVRKRAKEELGKDLPIGPLTISIGVAPIVHTLAHSHADWIASLAEADRLLYAAKAGGRNRVESSDGRVWLRARLGLATSRGAQAAGRDVKRESVLSGRIRWAGHKSESPAGELLGRVSDLALRGALERKIYTDSLTGAYNRAHLSDHLDGLLAGPRSVVAFDVDFFKKVNDVHGHGKGDEVLAALVALMREHFPSVWRMGGEEFVAIVHGAADEAYRIAEAFREAAARTLGPSVGLPAVTVSIGVAPAPQAGPAAERFANAVRAADDALYLSKQSGRNRTTIAAP